MKGVLELGSGNHPSPQATVRHDRIQHSPHIDTAFDLEVLPWPLDDESWDIVLATDVFEHLRLDIPQWLDECWRILKPGGQLNMRLPAWDNPLSYRDPTHRKVFHHESFYYWDPESHLWNDFGRYYFAESNRWWTVVNVVREVDDWRYLLTKRVEH